MASRNRPSASFARGITQIGEEHRAVQAHRAVIRLEELRHSIGGSGVFSLVTERAQDRVLDLELGAFRLDTPLEGLSGQQGPLVEQGAARDELARLAVFSVVEEDDEGDFADGVFRVVDDGDVELGVLPAPVLVLTAPLTNLVRQRQNAEAWQGLVPER